MATNTLKVYGICEWAKVQPNQLDLNFDKKSKSWKIDLYMTEGSFQVFEKSGLQLKVREGERGKFVRFARPERKLMRDVIKEMDPPYVIDTDNNIVESKVGNGSKVMLEVEVYDSMKGKGHTLVGVVVHDLVAYDEKKILEEELPW